MLSERRFKSRDAIVQHGIRRFKTEPFAPITNYHAAILATAERDRGGEIEVVKLMNTVVDSFLSTLDFFLSSHRYEEAGAKDFIIRRMPWQGRVEATKIW